MRYNWMWELPLSSRMNALIPVNDTVTKKGGHLMTAIISLTCEACGAPLSVPVQKKNIQCDYCLTWHELKKEGTQISIGYLNAWVCSFCENPNQVDTTYCAECSSRIGQLCPECQKLGEIAKTYCVNCGVDKEKTFLNKKDAKIQRLYRKIIADQRIIKNYEKQKNSISKIISVSLTSSLGIIAIFRLIIILGIGLIVFNSIFKSIGAEVESNLILYGVIAIVFGLTLAIYIARQKVIEEVEDRIFKHEERIDQTYKEVQELINLNYINVTDFSVVS
jgi:hypothetical protein